MTGSRRAEGPVPEETLPGAGARRGRGLRGAADLSWRLLVLAAAGYVVLYVLLQVRTVVLPVVLALLMTALLAPVAAFLRRLHVPNTLAAALTLLFFLMVIFGSLGLAAARTVAEVDKLTPTLQDAVDDLEEYLRDGPLNLDSEQIDSLTDSLSNLVSGGDAAATTARGLSLTVTALAEFVLMVFVMFFLLKDGPVLWRWFVERWPPERRAGLERQGQAGWHTLTSYTHGAVAVAAVDAVLIGAGLLVLGVPLALTLSLLTFFAAFVPIVGAVVAGAVAVLVAFAAKGIGTALLVLLLVLVVQQVEGNLLQPVIMKRAVSLHPLVIVTGVAAGGALYGIIGSALAVPLIAVAYSAARAGREPDPPEVVVTSVATTSTVATATATGGAGGPADGRAATPASTAATDAATGAAADAAVGAARALRTDPPPAGTPSPGG